MQVEYEQEIKTLFKQFFFCLIINLPSFYFLSGNKFTVLDTMNGKKCSIEKLLMKDVVN